MFVVVVTLLLLIIVGLMAYILYLMKGRKGAETDYYNDISTDSNVLEQKTIEEVLYVSVKAIELSLKEGVEKSMSRYNSFAVSPEQ